MCGISLVLDYAGSDRSPSSLIALTRLHDALAHRGPDGEGCILVDDHLRATRLPGIPHTARDPLRLAAAFRRLAIQDLSEAGAQPLSGARGHTWIMHNGEIYNHAELRKLLQDRGHQFRSESDSEVALAAYAEWGSDCFSKFEGMWAILIVDLDRARLVGSRDRLGIKPLFFSVDGDQIAFASEPQALALARRAGPQIEPNRFGEFLAGLPPQSPARSFFRDVHPVPAATFFEIDLRGGPARAPSFRTFWRLADHRPGSDSTPSYPEAVDRMRDLVQNAVRAHRCAAVPVGCLLSGGLDTSLLATLAATEGPLESYSIVYDDPQLSEWPYIQAVAAHAGIRSRTYRLTPEEAWADVDAVVRAQGQPVLGQELIAQYHAYRLAKAHGKTVVIEGQGADELLAGMPGYETAFLQELLLTLRWRELFNEARQRVRRYGEPWGHLLKRSFGSLVRPAGRRRDYGWLDAREAPAMDGDDDTPDPSRLNRYLYRLVRRTNLPAVLLYQDRGSMAHGVESRVPFLDHRLVEFCFTLPASFKAGAGTRKRILLDAARPFLPTLVLNRRDKKTFVTRQGFIPMRRDHGDALRDAVRSARIRTAPGVRGARLASFVENYLSGRHDDELAVWRLFTASRWLELFGAS